MNDKLVSVIIPLYNAEKYIERAIRSLEKQTVDGELYEILIINDGSTDRSQQICESLAQVYDNIFLLWQPNGGVSSARNKGLTNAKGKWIVFLDSDDYVKSNYIEKILSVPEKYEYVIFDNYIEDGSKLIKEKMWLHEDRLGEVTKEVALDWICNQKINAPWDKRFSRDFIVKNNISFDEKISMGEDLLFNLEYALKASLIYVSNDALCVHCYNSHGLCSTSKTSTQILTHDYVYLQSIRLLKEYELCSYISTINLCYLRILAHLIRRIKSQNVQLKEAILLLKKTAVLQGVMKEKKRSLKDIIRYIYIRLVLLQC